MPKITFLAPVYQKESWISETIQSLQQQTLQDIEILFIDDGSTDNTAEIIKWYMRKDKRIRLHKIGRNVGLGQAWNIGTKLVKSPIICVASGDDIWVKERAEITYEFFKKHKRVDVFYGAFYFCSYNLTPKEFKPAIPFSEKKLLTPREDGFSSQYIGHFVMAYKTKVGLKVPYRKDLKVGIDFPFLVDLTKAGCKFGWTKKSLGYARLLKTGVSIARRQEVDKVTKNVEKEL